jgi:RNA polymerase sigma-70 factor (ECF subfamily)
LNECRDPACFKAWIYRICRNLCLDHIKNVRRRMVSLDALSGSELASHPVVRPGQAPVWEAFECLPLALREAFLLKHDAGYTYDEVARIVGASPSAVKMRVHRARAVLREWLVEDEKYAGVGDDLALANRH